MVVLMRPLRLLCAAFLALAVIPANASRGAPGAKCSSIDAGSASPATERLRDILGNLNVPPLEPVPGLYMMVAPVRLMIPLPTITRSSRARSKKISSFPRPPLRRLPMAAS